jgi:hypothetical protein
MHYPAALDGGGLAGDVGIGVEAGWAGQGEGFGLGNPTGGLVAGGLGVQAVGLPENRGDQGKRERGSSDYGGEAKHVAGGWIQAADVAA